MAITVGIAGITGKFARLLTSALSKYPDVKIKGCCRDPSKVSQALTANSNLSLIKVVCCYLGDDHLMLEGQKFLIDICAEEGVSRYVASDWALDYTKLELGQLFPKDPMIKVKAYLESKKTIKGVHIIVGGFMEVLFNPSFGIWDPDTTTFKYWGTGDEMWEGTTYANAAEYTAAICVDENAVGVQRCVGGRSTIRDIGHSFEELYGMKPKLECLGTLNEMYTYMHHLRNTQPQNIYSYMFLFYQYYMINGQGVAGPELDNDKYPQVVPVDWEDFMKATPWDKLAGAYMGLAQGI